MKPKPVPGIITVPHIITNTSSRIDGNTATGRCYWREIALVVTYRQERPPLRGLDIRGRRIGL
jgi:hypothetical protein